MMASLRARMALASLVSFAHTGVQAAEPNRFVSLNVPLRLFSQIRPIDGSWQSFSIEFSYMADYLGNMRCHLSRGFL